MDVDDGELKIKGQAEVERRKSKWEDQDGPTKSELEQRENELKEKALRNKVIRTRKASNA
ncbi:hypothetical protein C8J57DRAFT_1083291 [Mycena rebaudengoi]|nr:hypothetical protein C8J57DRAFT_1083291 [Mycena rebaudengoi]